MKTIIIGICVYLIILCSITFLFVNLESYYRELSLISKKYETLIKQNDKMIKELDLMDFEIEQQNIIRGMENNNEILMRLKYLNNKTEAYLPIKPTQRKNRIKH